MTPNAPPPRARSGKRFASSTAASLSSLPAPSSLSTCEVGNSTVILNTAPHFSQVQNDARPVPALIRQTPRRAPPSTLSNFTKAPSSFSPYVSSNSLANFSNSSRSIPGSQSSSLSTNGASTPIGPFPGVNAKGTSSFSSANRSSFSGTRSVDMNQSFISARSSSSGLHEPMALPSLLGRSLQGNGATRSSSASFMHDGSRVKVVNQVQQPRRLSNESNTRHSQRAFQNADLSRSSRDALKPRSRPQLLPRSYQVPSIIHTKHETPRWIQGVLVKDSACQTSDSFRSQDYYTMPRMDDSLGTASFIAQNTDKYDEEYLVNLLEQPVEVTHESSRCHGPDADALQSGQFLMSELSASLVSSFQSIGVDSSLEAHEGEPMLISSVKQVVRPIAVRMGSRSVVLPPSTPLSERSGSASLEDGSSSVSSFTTLPSTISSPDSTKLANIMVSDEKSAFRTLHFSKNFSSVPLKTPLFYASLEDSSLVFNK